MFVYTSRYHKTIAWISLFALLMVSIAPFVSQSLMRHEYTPATHSQHHHSHTAIPHTGGADNIPSRHTIPMDDHAACGYCVLLSHGVLLLPAILYAIPARFTVITRNAIASVFWHATDSGYRLQQPRAPPAIHIPHQHR